LNKYGKMFQTHPPPVFLGSPKLEVFLLHIIVCVKQVPDTTNIRIDPDTGSLIRQGVPTILNPYDAHAVAAAIEWKRRLNGKVTVLSMGPPAASAALRECVEFGADRGVLLTARQFSGADTWATSYVLAESIASIHTQDPVDMVFFGKQAIDGDTAQVGPGVATRLGWPLATYTSVIREINLEARNMIVERKTENWNEVLRLSLPAVVTCEKEIAELPFASLPDLIRSLRFEPEVWSAESPLRFDPSLIGLKGSPTMVFRTGTPEKHACGETINVEQAGLAQSVDEALRRLLATDAGNIISGGRK
jgi:electron transfer flavoprotein beta subunit